MLMWIAAWFVAGSSLAGCYVLYRHVVELKRVIGKRKAALLDELAAPQPPQVVTVFPVGVRASVFVGPAAADDGPDAFIEHERERGNLS